jgi:hypothetical protein
VAASAREPLGERFRLKATTVAVGTEDGREVIVRIPSGAEVVVFDCVGGNHTEATTQVKVGWDGKLLRMFAVDLRERGERV